MKKQCRCCLTTNSNVFFDIFEQHMSGSTYAENICIIAAVQIDQNDGLSPYICFSCNDEVRRIHEFCLKVRQADHKLRQELEVTKSEIVDDQMENIQVVDNEYFTPVDDNGMQVCAMEEILEQENDQENVFMVEEIHDVEEVNIVEEELNLVKDQKETLLEGLALVAATQENVNIMDTYLPEDENDEDYLIEFDSNEANNNNNSKAQKWKCGECKVILRGDVSYEGHMNIHRQLRPHACERCQTKYRCRTTLKRHIDIKHSLYLKNEKIPKPSFICMDCNKGFYSENTFCLHQAFLHNKGDKCPFQCDNTNGINLKQHLESIHANELTETFYSNDHHISPSYQCLRCSETFEKHKLLQEHIKLCEIMEEERLQDHNEFNENENIEIIKVESAEIAKQCTICPKKILKRNLHKHMELHKRKEGENKVLDDTKSFLCSFCHNAFEDGNELVEHLSSECCQSLSYVTCDQCNEKFADLKNLQKHKKEAHNIKCLEICNICGNLFGGRAQLSAHKRLHKARPYKCDQCDKAYPRRVELDIHMRSHTGELPYECHLCDKRFAIKVRLTYHLQKHEGITHSCNYCSAVYDSRNKLKAHLFKHTGMPYKCEFCPGLGFERRLRFANHMKKIHQQILSEEELMYIFAKNTGKIVHFKNPQS